MSLLLNTSIVILALIFWRDALASKQEKMTNKHLVIAATSWPPFIELTKGNGGKIQVKGIIWEYVKFWLHARNFTYNVVEPEEWGWCLEPNNCTGLLGMVNRREADVAIGKYDGSCSFRRM